LVDIDRENNHYIIEWNTDEKEEIRALCQRYNMERENEKLTGKLTRTFMFSNGYYSSKYYTCTCPIPKFIQLADKHCLVFDAEVVSKLSRFYKLKE